MTTLNYDSIEEFCEELNDCIEEVGCANKETFVSVVAKYNDAKQIIRELVFYGYEIANIEINDPTCDNYNDEYEIYVIDKNIYCSKMKRNNKYLESFASIVFFMEDVNSKCIKSFTESVFEYEVQINDEHYERCCERNHDCDSTLRSIEEDGDVHGFTYSKNTDNGYESHSFYSTDPIMSYDLIQNIAKIWNLL